MSIWMAGLYTKLHVWTEWVFHQSGADKRVYHTLQCWRWQSTRLRRTGHRSMHRVSECIINLVISMKVVWTSGYAVIQKILVCTGKLKLFNLLWVSSSVRVVICIFGCCCYERCILFGCGCVAGAQLTGRKGRTWQWKWWRKCRSTKDVEPSALSWRPCRTIRSSTSLHHRKVSMLTARENLTAVTEMSRYYWWNCVFSPPVSDSLRKRT